MNGTQFVRGGASNPALAENEYCGGGLHHA